jgi:hypothetical protein
MYSPGDNGRGDDSINSLNPTQYSILTENLMLQLMYDGLEVRRTIGFHRLNFAEANRQ